ncbi:MFS transporter [Erwinia psidii]|uniref:MFS transporter n=1 Tax=Erwinia psidii TaxID=69224 RepID=A0A3N6TNH4_9GAMM|nr:MFS transporter [Erwinia psidii]MCX8958998.1 MFS transporter [Erwinia psidii]MCX8962802.1 MFS transporter [Erwinia psidii]MCX8966120.1 MFS transporter [Erwinia psidii]RQM36772.1 MFS transporter [Erwinia psidii]
MDKGNELTGNQGNEFGLFISILLLLLGCILFFFSFDRQIVSILKTTLMHEMGIGNKEYSWLITAFMFPYIMMYFVSGALVDKFGSRYVLTLLMILMSVATLITGFSRSLTGMLVGRFILGVAESGVVPALTLAIFTWFKAQQRAFAFQLTNIIQSLGLIVAPPFIAWVTLAGGWRWAFFIPALAGIMIGLMWFIASRRQPASVQSLPENQHDSISVLQRYKFVLTSAPVWTLIIARLLTDPFWFFYQYWQIGFMQEKLGLSLARVGELMWFPPLAAVFGVLLVCRISDRLVTRGVEPTRARLNLIWAVSCLAPLIFFLPTVENVWLAVGIMTVINFMCTAWLSMVTIMMGGLVPRAAIATAIGIMSALGGISAMLFNGFVGTIIDIYGYALPVYVGAVLHPAGAIVLAVYFLRRKNIKEKI